MIISDEAFVMLLTAAIGLALKSTAVGFGCGMLFHYLLRLTRRCQNALTRVMKPDGFNIGVNLGKVAGAGILEHLHLHVVPRWNGDTNFMPVTAGTTVVPQALKELAARLREELAAESAPRAPHSAL